MQLSSFYNKTGWYSVYHFLSRRWIQCNCHHFIIRLVQCLPFPFMQVDTGQWSSFHNETGGYNVHHFLYNVHHFLSRRWIQYSGHHFIVRLVGAVYSALQMKKYFVALRSDRTASFSNDLIQYLTSSYPRGL